MSRIVGSVEKKGKLVIDTDAERQAFFISEMNAVFLI